MVVSHINIHEYLFSVDDFDDPKVLKNSDAIGILLTRLLLLEPGTFQSHPTMGVGLVSKYRGATDENITDLITSFRRQIETYLPQYQGVEVNAALKNHVIYISATIDGTIYAFFYNTDTNEIKTTFKTLGEL